MEAEKIESDAEKVDLHGLLSNIASTVVAAIRAHAITVSGKSSASATFDKAFTEMMGDEPDDPAGTGGSSTNP